MITIRIDADPLQGRAEIIAEGHAGYAERGKDIVCAAVSTLMYTLAYNILLIAGADVGEDGRVCDMREGYARICISASASYRALCMPAFQTVVNGILMLSERYGEYVRVEIADG